MDVGSRTEWDERTPQTEIDRRKEYCRNRLGIEIARWLKLGHNSVVVNEVIEHQDHFGLPRTVYTLRAEIR